MKLSETTYDNRITGCCAPVNEAHWEGRLLDWNDKLFLKDHIREFFHIPLNFGAVMRREHTAIEAAEAYAEEPLWLSDEISPWGADIYFALDREVPGANVVKLSGKFITKAFSGPYRDIGRWVREMDVFVKERGFEVKKLYFYYATCPDCAKKLGGNQVVLFAEV